MKTNFYAALICAFCLIVPTFLFKFTLSLFFIYFSSTHPLSLVMFPTFDDLVNDLGLQNSMPNEEDTNISISNGDAKNNYDFHIDDFIKIKAPQPITPNSSIEQIRSPYMVMEPVNQMSSNETFSAPRMTANDVDDELVSLIKESDNDNNNKKQKNTPHDKIDLTREKIISIFKVSFFSFLFVKEN